MTNLSFHLFQYFTIHSTCLSKHVFEAIIYTFLYFDPNFIRFDLMIQAYHNIASSALLSIVSDRYL